MRSLFRPAGASLANAFLLLTYALLSRAVPNDRLVLADATLLAAIDGSRALTANERQALQASPLTLRRFRHLVLERRADSQTAREAPTAANDATWSGSHGMLRAAAEAHAAHRGQVGAREGDERTRRPALGRKADEGGWPGRIQADV